MAGSVRRRTPSFWPLAILFGLYVLFLYGPVFTIFTLSFQGPDGGLTFPMQGSSLHWYRELFKGLGVVDIGAALGRSLSLGAVVMVLTVLLSLLAGLAFRKGFKGGGLLFYTSVASLIMPSIIISLGIGLQFRLFDGIVKTLLEQLEWTTLLESYTTLMGLYTSGLGAHLTWTLPFGMLIMFAVFNRFNPAYEEAARDMGA
ncbi:MAG: ABC transporter permease, partial [Rubrivivax sp.]